MSSRALALVLLLAASLPVSAAGQDDVVDDEAADGEADAEDAAVPNTAAAAEAYDRGSAFYLNQDYARAAQWFETAYRLAPAPPALIQALRAQVRTGHVIRAANLALRLRGLHGDDADARALADEVIAENGSDFVLLEVSCEGCQLEIEGRVWSYPAAFLTPSTDHDVLVTQGDRRERHSVRGLPGQRIQLGAPSASGSTGVDEPDAPRPPPPASGTGAGLSPWVFGASLGLTLVSGAILIWSGVDTLDGVDAFNAMPTPEAFEAGQDKELRTNVLVGITAGLGLLTVLFAILADWDGDPPDASTAGVWLDGRSGGAWLRTSF